MAFGVSNSFKRGTIKTYSKQRRHAEAGAAERPAKRIRMDPSGRAVQHTIEPDDPQDIRSCDLESRANSHPPPCIAEETASTVTVPSSPLPLDRALLSSDAPQSESELSTPPSSPPRSSSPILETRKPAFSFLKRKRINHDEDSRQGPLTDIAPNAQRHVKRKKRNLTQMRIDLGGDTRKKCRSCGMEYIPSVREDADTHKDFCVMNVSGIEIGKTLLKDESVSKLMPMTLSLNERESIILIDKRSSAAARNKVQKILSVVNTELGSADLEEERLWSEIGGEVTESKADHKRKGFYSEDKKYDQFKALLHMIDGRCVSFCLAQKISHAFAVVAGGKQKESSAPDILLSVSSSIAYSPATQVVLLGISRIWTSKSYRGKGFGVNMLECARTNFFYGVQVPRHLVAFSQPTESGSKLARRWFGMEVGWHVYHQ